MHLMVLGYARHGKDSVCDILANEYGLKFQSSSYFVAERAVRPWLAAKDIRYDSFDEMYADRVNHRDKWYDAIAEYNRLDPTRLGRELYEQFDIYCGIRQRRELKALQMAGVIDCTFWVDASERLPPEDPSSISVRPTDANWIINNNGPQEALPQQVHHAMFVAQSIYAFKRGVTHV